MVFGMTGHSAANKLFAGLAAGSQPTVASSTRTYRVASGDTLNYIAQRYGTTVDAIKRANSLTSDVIYLGEELKIPGSGGNGGGSAVTPPDDGSVLLDVPTMNQYTAGGSYPWGYCAITALRMVLRHRGLSDPGADAVALYGARPYIPGAGSDGTRLARRARELGVSGARFTNTGSLDDVNKQLENGNPVPIGGIGYFSGRAVDGSGTHARRYDGSGHWMLAVGYQPDKGQYLVNDPDTGKRYYVSEYAFKNFFSPGGANDTWMLSY